MPNGTHKALLSTAVLCTLWCLMLVALFQRNAHNEEAHATALAGLQARTLCAQMLDTRAWNAAHGGVYVRESEYGSANPWLPEGMRRATLNNGERLVLINPAYMSRQIADRTAAYGARLRITSHAPLRPENLADDWESAALREIESGAAEVFSLQKDAAGKENFRYMAPLRTESSCLHCHTGSSLNDVRGGISVILEAQPFLHGAQEHRSAQGYMYGVLGLTGMLGIGSLSFAFGRRRSLAEQKSRMKNAFLANMSHDMRTPLAGIMGMTELLQSEPDSATRRRAYSYLRSAAEALLEMITDITAHAALDTGKLHCARKAFELENCLQSCLDLFRPACTEKRLKLILDLDHTLPPVLIGDAFRLRQALGNLVGNAIKFTAQGFVRVTVTGTREKNNALFLRIEVRDSGPGIPAHELAAVFEPFTQGAQTRQLGIPGTGLGLAISHELARLMGGSLDARSLVGRGSTFTLTLRCALPASPEEAGAESPATHDPAEVVRADCPNADGKPAARALRIVLAEDNKAGAFFLRKVLEQAGHSVATAHNGFEALALLTDYNADLAVLDMHMPGLDGLEAARRIRAGRDGIDPELPILSITATRNEEIRKELEDCGVNTQLEKPVSTALLLQTVQTLCAGRANASPKRDRPDPACAASSSGAHQEPSPCCGNAAPATDASCREQHFDPAAALQAVHGDHGLLLKLAAVLLDDLSAQSRALDEAAANGDPAAMRLPAHALKNSSAMLRLDTLHSACTALENAVTGGKDILQARLEVERALPEAQKALSAFLNSAAQAESTARNL